MFIAAFTFLESPLATQSSQPEPHRENTSFSAPDTVNCWSFEIERQELANDISLEHGLKGLGPLKDNRVSKEIAQTDGPMETLGTGASCAVIPNETLVKMFAIVGTKVTVADIPNSELVKQLSIAGI